MAFSVSYIYEILDRYSPQLRKISETTRRFGRIIETTQRRARNLGRTLKGVGDTMSRVGQTMVTRITLVGAAVAGLALKASADIEQLTVSFGVMLRDMDKGAALMERLKTFAAKTPFEMKGVAQAAKTLLAFRVSNEDLIPRMTMLGDIASGVNAPFKDISQIFGKVKAKGKLMAEELNQMSERGIPMIAMLAGEIKKKLGISMDKATAMVYKMGEQGKITFPVMLKMMQKMTGEGGIFNNMMALQSKTLGGLFSTLKDSIFFGLAGLGDTIVKLFDVKGIIDRLSVSIESIVKRFNAWAEANPGLAKMALSVIGIVMAIGPLLLILGPVVKLLGFTMAGFGMVSGVVLAVVAGIALLVFFFKRWSESSHPMIKTLGRLWRGMEPLWNVVVSLANALGTLIGWLVGTSEETGVLVHVVDALALGLSTSINLVAALLELVFGDSEVAGNIFTNMLADLNEFRKGTGLVAQVYDGMVNRVSSWIEKVANFFTMLKTELLAIGAAIESSIPDFMKAQSFGQFMNAIQGGGGEDSASTKAQNTANQGVDISGIIAVQAADGSTVEKAAIEVNQGDNLATVMN